RTGDAGTRRAVRCRPDRGGAVMKQVSESLVIDALDDLASRGDDAMVLDMARGAVHLALMLDLIDIPEYRRRCDALIEAKCGPTAGWHTGLSIRDHFAAKAMPALIQLFTTGDLTAKDGRPATEEHIAEQACCFADAMLAQRAKEQA